MHLSKRQPRNPLAKAILILAFCLCQAGLLAQGQTDLILFSITDESHHRIEVVIPEGSDPAQMVMRFYEDGDFLLWEMPLRGNLQLEGQATKPTRVILLNQDQGRHETSTEEPHDILITDNSGSGTPPTGPPNPPEDPPSFSSAKAQSRNLYRLSNK